MRTKEKTALTVIQKIVRASQRIDQQRLWIEEARRKIEVHAPDAAIREREMQEVEKLRKLLREDEQARHELAKRVGLDERFPVLEV